MDSIANDVAMVRLPKNSLDSYTSNLFDTMISAYLIILQAISSLLVCLLVVS